MRASAHRTSTTVVAIVGDGSRACLARLAALANVAVPTPDDSVADRTAGSVPERKAGDDPLDRAVAAWAEAVRVHTPYFAHDADPLERVGDAWVRRYDEQGPIGELEVAVQATLARWRVGSIELPDYYVVLDAEAMVPTRRHWYLGVLHKAAPARVVPVPNAHDAAAALPRLTAGRWWPDLDQLLDGIAAVVPDHV
jgi:hypothetical protein